MPKVLPGTVRKAFFIQVEVLEFGQRRGQMSSGSGCVQQAFVQLGLGFFVFCF